LENYNNVTKEEIEPKIVKNQFAFLLMQIQIGFEVDSRHILFTNSSDSLEILQDVISCLN